MEVVQIGILIVFIVAVIFSIRFLRKKNVVADAPVPALMPETLQQLVPFYRQLTAENKKEFEERAALFLTQVRITGVNTTVEDLDRILIAASAIIPIFNFKEWEYQNLHEVLLYPDSFDHGFRQEGRGRSVLGMVGSGALNHIMILSQYELRQAFISVTGKDNTAIHEFVHLLDKSDGGIDGIPESLLDKKYLLPWLQLMRQKIQEILNNESDINPYGATDEAEFFAVVSEYFFERPELLKEKHPDLYHLLLKIFNPAQA